MWQLYKHTGKDSDYKVYKEALNAATNEVMKSKRNKLAQSQIVRFCMPMPPGVVPHPSYTICNGGNTSS